MDKGIDGVTALGFGLQEYIKMFALTEDELNMRILDYRAGASCFAADMYAQGKQVVACDPLYQKPLSEIMKLVAQAADSLKDSFKQDAQEFSVLPDKAEAFMEIIQLGTVRFFEDFPKGLAEQRYTTDQMPKLSFKDEAFNLALVCHYLFTFSDQLTVSYHYEAIKELVRVANEVRIFPLVTTAGKLSPHVGEVVAKLQSQSYGVEIRGVEYELQNQGNAMLRVWAPQCQLSAHQAFKSQK